MNITLNKNQYKLNNHNNKQKSTTFTGHTESAIPIYKQKFQYSHYGANYDIVGYTLQEGATPNYPGAYPNEHTKVYVADPYEIIPEEAYKTHDFTKRNDLRLSDIKNRYKNGYQNFANNAYMEELFLKQISWDVDKKVKRQSFLSNAFEERVEFSNKYQNRLESAQKNLENEQTRKQILDEQIKNAGERYNLLKDLDDKGPKYSETRNKIYSYNQYYSADTNEEISKLYDKAGGLFKVHKQNKIKHYRSISKAASGNKTPEQKIEVVEHIEYYYKKYKESMLSKIQYIREQIKDIKEVQNAQKELPILEKALEECMKKVEILYKTKYPNWL